MSIGRKIKLGLAGLLLGLTISLGACKDKDKHIPIGTGTGTGTINHAPVIEQPIDDTSIEKQLYTKLINMSDEDNDEMTPYIIEAPEGATISKTSSTTAEVYWTPNDSQSNMTHTFTIGVEDNNSATTQATWTNNAINVVDYVSGVVNEIAEGDIPISGIEVQLGNNTTYTNSFGEYLFEDLQDGDYTMIIKDPLNQFVTYKPGILQVTKTREHNGKLQGLESRLIPEEHFYFCDYCARGHPECIFHDCVVKWEQKPKYLIYTKYASTGEPVEQDKIDLVLDIITNRISGKFTDANRNIMNFTYDGSESDDFEFENEEVYAGYTGPVRGYIEVFWDIDGGGGNLTDTENNKIIYARARGPPYLGEADWMQELHENMVGSGETHDTNYNDSIFYDGSTNTILSCDDSLWINLHKNRIIGNKDLRDGNSENRDVNPNGTYINP